MNITAVNHIAIICSDYERSLAFYKDVLGFTLLSEEYRKERQSMMTKMALNGQYLLELFTFPNSPERPSYPEACGLRHLAFTVDDIVQVAGELESKGIAHEPIRISPDGTQCFFFADPDGLPIEIVQEKPYIL